MDDPKERMNYIKKIMQGEMPFYLGRPTIISQVQADYRGNVITSNKAIKACLSNLNFNGIEINLADYLKDQKKDDRNNQKSKIQSMNLGNHQSLQYDDKDVEGPKSFPETGSQSIENLKNDTILADDNNVEANQEFNSKYNEVANGCSQPESMCKINSCLNGGICINEKNGAICDCSGTPFGGERCERRKYALFSKPRDTSCIVQISNLT